MNLALSEGLPFTTETELIMDTFETVKASSSVGVTDWQFIYWQVMINFESRPKEKHANTVQATLIYCKSRESEVDVEVAIWVATCSAKV